MPRVIWKLEITEIGESELLLPTGAIVLNVSMQHGLPFIWFICNPTAPKKKYKFLCVGTGKQFDATGWNYVGTFLAAGGELVFHLFDKGL
jgi:hypothetical protein